MKRDIASVMCHWPHNPSGSQQSGRDNWYLCWWRTQCSTFLNYACPMQLAKGMPGLRLRVWLPTRLHQPLLSSHGEKAQKRRVGSPVRHQPRYREAMEDCWAGTGLIWHLTSTGGLLEAEVRHHSTQHLFYCPAQRMATVRLKKISQWQNKEYGFVRFCNQITFVGIRLRNMWRKTPNTRLNKTMAYLLFYKEIHRQAARVRG